jgi:hypothetical protein
MLKCHWCEKELVGSNYFCSVECENEFRNNNKELYLLYKDGNYNWICPVLEFEENDNELICDNGSNKYIIEKSKIEKWKIDICSCLQYFTEIDYYKI